MLGALVYLKSIFLCVCVTLTTCCPWSLEHVHSITIRWKSLVLRSFCQHVVLLIGHLADGPKLLLHPAPDIYTLSVDTL